MLCYEHETFIGDAFNTLIKKGEKNIECSSSVYNFNFVEINESNGNIEISKAK